MIKVRRDYVVRNSVYTERTAFWLLTQFKFKANARFHLFVGCVSCFGLRHRFLCLLADGRISIFGFRTLRLSGQLCWFLFGWSRVLTVTQSTLKSFVWVYYLPAWPPALSSTTLPIHYSLIIFPSTLSSLSYT